MCRDEKQRQRVLGRYKKVGNEGTDGDIGGEKRMGGYQREAAKGVHRKVQVAKKKNKKGKASGGMITGVRKGIEVVTEGEGEEEQEEEDGKIKWDIRVGEERWRVVGVYINADMERKLEGLKGWMEEREKGVKTIIGGDFKARTGEEGGWGEEEEQGEDGRSRKSKDKKVNREGRKLLECIEERGWIVLNESVKGDEESEYMYTGGREGRQ